MKGKTKPFCLNCGKEEAINNPPYGWVYGKSCQKKHKSYQVKEAVELVSDEIKEQRKEYEPDTLQRYVGDTPNLKYLKTYGEKGFTKEEIKAARNDSYGYYTNKEERYH